VKPESVMQITLKNLTTSRLNQSDKALTTLMDKVAQIFKTMQDINRLIQVIMPT